MSETFVSDARITQRVLNPRTGCAELIDFQYERERRTPKPVPSPRTYKQQVDHLADAILKAAGLSFVREARDDRDIPPV